MIAYRERASARGLPQLPGAAGLDAAGFVDEEFLRDSELIALFGLEGISRSNAVFDHAKLDWFNTRVHPRLLRRKALQPLDRGGVGKVEPRAGRTDPAWLLATIDLLKPRARNLKDFAHSFRAFFTDDFQADPAAADKYLKDES